MGGAPSGRCCGLTQNPAGPCWQWVRSWRVCGSRRGAGIVRRESVIVGASLSWPAATLAPAATCWMNRVAKRSAWPGELARWASVRRRCRMLFTVTSWWAGLGGAAAGCRR